MEEIPVYLFTGFMDSGKTSLIHETLYDNEFGKDARNLVICCEDGEVEYEEAKLHTISGHLAMIEEQEEFTEEKLKQFGALDATAVAKFYGLKSEILGVDYGSYQKVEIPIPSAAVKPDTSEPDVCMIDAGDVDKETGEAEVSIYAVDYDSYLVYYSYSLDGGESFSKLQKYRSGAFLLLLKRYYFPS